MRSDAAIVLVTTLFHEPKVVAEASEAVIGSMKGLAAAAIAEQELLQMRGWWSGVVTIATNANDATTFHFTLAFCGWAPWARFLGSV
jgi:hypothetical protein